MSKTIDVSDLPEPFVSAIEAIVKTYRDDMRPANHAGQESPPIGWLKGKWELPESFFEPLPRDLTDLFNGEDEP